jgi:hypothetical protein
MQKELRDLEKVLEITATPADTPLSVGVVNLLHEAQALRQ